MNFTKKTAKGALCIVLTILMLVTMLSGLTVFAENASSLAPTGSAYVYCRNSAGWGTVYAYAWTNGADDQNAAWPGEAMTNIGDNVWRYEVSTSYAHIIFNNGQGTQTADLDCQTTSYIFDNSSNSWQSYESGETTATTATTATNSTSGTMAYCKNDAGWGTVYAYCWNSADDSNAAWPGEAMTNIGDNVWQYSMSKSYANIIFNNGQGTQTADLVFPGSDQIFNNSTNSWSSYSGGETTPTSSTSATTSTTATTATQSSPDDYVVFCKNSAGWSTVTAYCWNSGTDSNGSWPGVKMTDIGEDVWQYNLPKTYKNIIFSNNGQSQTADLVLPGSGYIYDNSTGGWEIYDLSPLRVLNFKTDLASPQYKGSEITISTEATSSGGEVSYKFSVKNNSTSAVTVLSAHSSDNTVKWEPTATGSYTIIIEYKDTAGNTNSREIAYSIEDDSSLEAPVIKKVVAGDDGYVLKGSACDIDVTAGGGNTGTKILFYKYTIEDASGNTVNVPYYTTSKTYKYTPSATGTYSLTVSVQASDVNNTTVEREVEFECVTTMPTDDLYVKSFTTDGDLTKGSTITISASAAGGTSPYTYQFLLNNKVIKNYSSANTYSYKLTDAGTFTIKVNVTDADSATASKTLSITVKDVETEPTTEETTETQIETETSADPVTLRGDADSSGIVDIKDATTIMKYNSKISVTINLANADVTDDGKVSVADATKLQQFFATLIEKL